MNAINWMDSRGAPHVKEIIDGPVRVAGYGVGRLFTWLRLTGGIPQHAGKDSIAHILYLKHERPDIYRAAHKFLEPMDYINLRLTGAFAASYTTIGLHWVTDNRDINNITYSDRLIRMAAIDRDKLPDLRPTVDVLGTIIPEVADELGLSSEVKVVTGLPDVHSAAVGSGAVRDFEPHLYVGTSTWMTCHVPFKKTDVFHNMASMPSAIPGRYFVLNEQETSGACLNFLKNNLIYHEDELLHDFDLPDVYKVFDQIVERVPPGADGVIFTPWLHGERTPIDDHLARGGFFNLSLHNTREHLLRAVFEGVAYNARWLFHYVERFAGRRLDNINIIGGGANSNVWCQIFADVFDRTIRQVKDPVQANARGAAVNAAVALGYMTFDEFADRVEIANVFTPDPANRDLYDELYAAFLEIYKRNKKIYSLLNRRR
jgi:xylulokinase